MKNKGEKVNSVTAKEIIELVGGFENIDNYYTCITRLRIVVKNKDLVNIEKIKSLQSVKGCLYSGMELQIVLGNVVNKVYEAIFNLKNTQKEKGNYLKKLKTSITEILVPVIPIFLVCGMMKTLESLLIFTNAIDQIPLNYKELSIDLSSFNFFSVLIFLLSNVGIVSIGIFVCYTTTKFLKGNELFSIFIALSLFCPMLFFDKSINLVDKNGFQIKIGGMVNSFLPFIILGFLSTFLDKWLKKNLPGFADSFLRPLLVFLVSILLSIFVIIPLISWVDFGIFKVVELAGYIKYGIGSMIFGFSWIFLVMTGMHIIVLIPFNIVLNNQDTWSYLGPSQWIACFAQSGVALGILIKKFDKSFFIENWTNVFPGLVFGVIEPSLYAINFKTKHLVLIGAASAGVMSLTSGLLNIKQYVPVGAGGFFSLLGTIQGGIYEMLMLLAIYLGTILLSVIGVLFLVRKEKINLEKR